MNNYKKRAPVSSDAKWTEMYRDDGILYAKFQVKHMNVDSPEYLLHYRRATDQLSQSEKVRADNPKTPEDVLIRRNIILGILATSYVTDSEIMDETDKPLPHNMATVAAYLMDPDNYDIAQDLDRFASNSSNFRAVAAATETKKN